jgi:hypothetical protein
MNRRYVLAAAVTLLLVAVAAPSGAFTISGKVVNGTTGDKSPDVEVIVVNPSGGMTQEKKVRTVDGRFTVSDLENDSPIFLVRVDYKGISFTESVRPGEQQGDVVVMIYEPTDSWEDVRVSIPHLVAQRDGSHLVIEQLYELNNVGNHAIAGDEAAFRFRVPPENHGIEELYVSALGMPIERTPEPTDDPGIYKLSYPIRPGITRVGLAYSVPYEDDTFTITDELLFDVDEIIVYGVDPDMKVMANVDVVAEEAAHEMVAYTMSSLERGTKVELTFTGGSGRSSIPSESQQASPGAVTVVPNEMEDVSLMMMVIVLLALLAFMGIAVQGGGDPLDQPAKLRAYYEVLLKRLARLDDLRHAEAIPTDVYRHRREEIKSQLAALMQRLRESEPDAHKRYVGPSTDAAPSKPGEEQRSAS